MAQGQYSPEQIDKPKGQGQYGSVLSYQSPTDVSKAITPDIINQGAKTVANIDPVTIASGVAGAAAGVGSAGVPGLDAFSSIIGSGTMSATDHLLRGLTGEYKPSSAIDVLTDTAKDALVNEMVGKAADFVLAKGNALYDALKSPAKTMTDFDKLLPTFSQLLRKANDPLARTMGGFEDLFAPTSKVKALQNSFEAAKDEGTKFIESLTGRKGISLEDASELPRLIKAGSEQTVLDLYNESNSRGEAAKLIAEANPVKVKVTAPSTSAVNTHGGILDESGNPIVTGGKPSKKVVSNTTINGPIDYTNTLQQVMKLKKEIDTSSIPPDPESPVYKALTGILDATKAKFDKAGNLVSSQPVSFGQAWKDKQIAGDLGYGSPFLDRNITDGRFKAITGAIDSDIETSLPKWQVNGDKALNLFTEAKAIVTKRNALFNPTNEKGQSLAQVLNDIDTPMHPLNAIMDSPDKLQRFLNSGSVVIPSGQVVSSNGIPSSPIKIITSNARRDAQGYQMMRMLNDATVPDSMDATKNVFDSSKLMSTINDPNRQEALKLLYGSTGLSNIKQFFKNITMTSQKGSNIGASRYLALKVGAFGVSFGAGIATALTEGVTTPSGIMGGIGSIVTFGGHELAKWMTNPESARIMLSMAQGSPLGMSTQMATRILVNSIRNRPVTLTYSDGNTVDGKINNEGKFTIPIDLSFNGTKLTGTGMNYPHGTVPYGGKK